MGELLCFIRAKWEHDPGHLGLHATFDTRMWSKFQPGKRDASNPLPSAAPFPLVTRLVLGSTFILLVDNTAFLTMCHQPCLGDVPWAWQCPKPLLLPIPSPGASHIPLQTHFPHMLCCLALGTASWYVFTQHPTCFRTDI